MLPSSLELEKEFVRGLSLGGGIGGLLYTRDENADVGYFHYDGQGNVVAVSDEARAAVAYYEYDAWGNVLTACGSYANEFAFSTKQASTGTGLVDFGYRWYDSKTARWTQRDPIGVHGGTHVYAYVGVNPTNALDPWGLKSWSKSDVEMMFFAKLHPLTGPGTELGKNIIRALHMLYDFLGTVQNVVCYSGEAMWFKSRDDYFDWFEGTVDQVRLENGGSHTSSYVVASDGSTETGKRVIVLDIGHYTGMSESDVGYMLMVAVQNLFHESMHLTCEVDAFPDGNVPHTPDPYAYTDPRNDKPGYYNAWFREWRKNVCSWVGKKAGVDPQRILEFIGGGASK